MGPSGSGKSTLMNLIGLLDSPSAGRLTLAGEETTRLSSDRLARLRNSQIGFVFQSYNLLARNTALQNVELPLIYGGVRSRDRACRAEAALAAVGLTHRLRHWPVQLSGGEQQRVAIARALVCEPAFILADEPTGALDSRTGGEILALFRRLNLQGRTIVLVTHDERIAANAGRVLRLQDGAVVGDGAARRPTMTATGMRRPDRLAATA
jgi:putative ABC transport system ATP-binding protein